jgi:DNA-binding XRE family transcriptional regulator
MPKIIEFLGYDPTASVPTTLGERLRKYRKSHGLNQKQLAKMIGIDPTTLSRVEGGRVDCPTAVKNNILMFLPNRTTSEGTQLDANIELL